MAQAQGSGQPAKHSLWRRSTRQQVEAIVTEHVEDCLIDVAGECTCDAMTDAQIDAELLEKEDAKD
jgi:hypothetical protein